MTSFSSNKRTSLILELETSELDVLVVGGGITGAGIALDASVRGLKVGLVEMQDFAGGTSGRSTKLIHGGLRYLKQLELGLVAEVGQERKIIHHLAPHLTKPEPMLLPVMYGDAMGKTMARIGMFIYERLAKVLPYERHRSLDAAASLKQEPLLKKEKLNGGILFYEYRTDDARLTLEVMKKAVEQGTIALNYLRLTSFIYGNGKVAGAHLTDELSGRHHVVKAKYIVNATGPWVDELDILDKPQAPKLKITKGTHLVFDHEKFPVKQSVYFEAFDKRMLFVIPRGGKTYLGTTDTFYNGDRLNPPITKEDRDYLLHCANRYFEVSLSPADIESGWAGLRPLIGKPGKKAGEISRKDEIFISASNLITIAGGKLTGYRKMAQRVMTVIAANFRKDSDKILPPSTTDRIWLSGGKLTSSFREFLSGKIKEGEELGLVPVEAEKLVYRYGAATDTIYNLMRKINAGDITPSHKNLPPLVYAQLIYVTENELCLTAADFFIRRTGMIYFDISLVEKWKDAVVAELKLLLPEVPDFKRNDLEETLGRIRALRE